MILKDLIEKLKEYPEDTFVSVNFTYDDSDEGECFGNIDKFEFKYSTNKRNKFLTIREAEE